MEDNIEKKYMINEEYLDTIDKNPLIDKTNIINTVEHYIKNYESTEYQDYKDGKMTNKIYPKIGRKYNMIKRNGLIELIDVKLNETVIKLKEPIYILINEKLKELEEDKNILKTELDNEYNELNINSNKNMNTKEQQDFNIRIKEFEKMKNKYIQILENIEVYKLYYLVINKINIKDVKDITQSIIIEYYGNDNQLVEKKRYKIPESIINNYITSQGEKLDNYNKLKQLMNTNKVNKKDIKKFLELSNNISETHNNNIKEYLVDNNINYIVLELPKFI